MFRPYRASEMTGLRIGLEGDLLWIKRALVRALFFVLCIPAATAPGFAQTLLSNDHDDKTFHVGLRIADFECNHPNGEKELVTVALWYPTEEEPQPFTYHTERDYVSSVALNASAARKGSPYPLIVFAHGAYGSGYNSAFFMEYLARHGYVCAAADYQDTIPPGYKRQIAFSRIKGGNTGNPLRVLAIAGRFARDMNESRDFFLSYLAERRLQHTSFVIDEMIGLNVDPYSSFHQTIKENAIGICGHSLGGLTALGKIGAHPAGKFRDDRIKAALIFSASGYPFESTLDNIHVPVMLMVGDDDAPSLRPELPRRIIYDRANAPRFYLVLKDATHFTFGNRGCGQLPLDQAVKKNSKISAICRYGLAFFDKYVRGNASASGQLGKPDPAWAYYAKEEKAGERLEWGKEPPPGTGGPGGIRKEFRERRETEGWLGKR